MPVPFQSTLRGLRAERVRTPWSVVLATAALLVPAGRWLTRTDLPVYAASSGAWIEAERAPAPVVATTPGRLAVRSCALGATVRRGDLLFAVAAPRETAELAARETRSKGVEARLAALDASRRRAEESIAAARREHGAALATAESRAHAARARANEARAHAKRQHALARAGILATATAERAEAEAAEADLLAHAAERERRAAARRGERDVADLRLALADLDRARTALRAERADLDADADAVRAALGERHIVAPMDGVVAEVAPLEPGAMISAGDHLATIAAPAGSVRVRAIFPAATVLGRLHPGQPASLRLDAFPWRRYGAAEATLVAVGEAARDGQVTVEARLDTVPPGLRPALRHGPSGTLLVTVEQRSPLALLASALERRFGGAPPPSETSAPGERAVSR